MDTKQPFVWNCPVCGTKVLGTTEHVRRMTDCLRQSAVGRRAEEAATHMFDCASTDMDGHYGGFVKYGVKQPFAEEFLWLSKGAPADDPPERFRDRTGGTFREY